MSAFADNDDQGLRITLFALLSVVFLVGVSGNAIICNTFRKNASLQTVTNLVIINMATTAIIQCLLNIPVSLTNLVLGRWAFGDVYCQVNGLSSSVCLFESMFSLVVLSGSRYCCILHPTTFQATFSKRRTLSMIASSWLLAFALSSPPLFGWSDFQPGASEMMCVSMWKHSVSYTSFVAITVFLIPTCAIIAVYSKIYRHIKAHQRLLKLYTLATAVPLGNTLHRRRRSSGSVFKDYQVTKLILTLFVIFVASWGPYFAVNLIFEALEDTIPARLDVILTWSIICNTACSPIVYGLMNRQLRRGFCDSLRCLKTRAGTTRESIRRQWTSMRYRDSTEARSSLRTWHQTSRANYPDANPSGVVMCVSSV